MEAWLRSGLLIDIAIAVLLLELVALVLWRWRAPRGSFRPLDVAFHLLAGAFLMVALRSAVVGADYRIVLLAMTASLPMHLVDLVRRIRTADRPRAADGGAPVEGRAGD